MFLGIGIDTTKVKSVLIDDGQTIIGTALVVLSDGLERDDRVIWLTPLALDPAFEPRTAGLVAARPHLDKLGDGASIDSICAQVLALASERAAA